jgi:hypothetical protein
MRAHLQGRRNRVAAVALAALAAVSAITIVGGTTAQAAPALPGDGTTSTTAGASCWGIKQQHPASTTGTYWLSTAALERPQQFHCDMTTDGGGWVLIGRGRQGWTFNPFGQGSPSTVRSTVDGAGAFAPAALPEATVDALLDGQPLSEMADGFRLERSTNSSGSQRQDVEMFPAYANWTWSLAAGQLLQKVELDGRTYAGSNTFDTSDSVFGQTQNGLSGLQGTRRVFTFKWASHSNQAGFSFGSGVSGGSSSSTNHLWTASNEGHPIPFTRVWVRPRIANDAAGFTPIPAAGFGEQAKPAVLKNRSELAPWGVTGLDHTNEATIEPWNTSVLSMRALGDKMFVGGRFDTVQQGPTGTRVGQKYLAAFTADGAWIDSFRPTLNGRVWDMVVTGDGKLIIAGDFTSVNGQPNTSGLAALDPSTGAVISSWKANVTSTSGRVLVRALDIRNDTIYAAGSFNRYTGGTWNTITVSNAVAMSAVNGTPSGWRPRLSGSGVRLDVTDDGSRVLVAGYFNRINDDTNHGYFGITDATTGNPVPGIGSWTPSVGSNARYQQAVADLGDGRYAVGGSEHNIQLWNAQRTELLDAAVTRQGGDTQAIELFDGKAYIGCHCGNWVYEGTNNWTTPTGFRSVEPINLIGAWDLATWDHDTSWYPSSLKGARGEGVWAIEEDSRGCIWAGGDLNRGSYSGNAATDWLGGFARFCQEDVTPPSAPWNLSATTAGSGVVLNWASSTDASGTVSYDVYRDDRVIATVFGRTFTDPEVTGTHRYTVRATDARGNRSASPAPISVNGPSPVLAQPIAFGSSWRYLATTAPAPAGWQAPDFADAAWPQGNGKLGWGRSDIATTVGPNRPLTSYYRTSFEVTDASSVRTLDLSLSNLQGAVVYVNGIEAGRLNMPSGPITPTTPAAGYLTTAQENALRGFVVPGSLLRNGTNVVAVEVHSVTANAGRQMMGLQATLYAAGGDASAPSAPVLSAASGGAGRIDLSWSASSDDVALGGYRIERDGQTIAVAGAAATTFGDAVDTTVPHSYVVTAFDTNGNERASGAVTVSPAADPNLLPAGSTWHWFYAEGGPTAGWQNDGYDDTTWATGQGELGYGDSDERTIISTNPTPRPLTAYFRTTIDITDPTAFTTIAADLIRDDGAVLYINGTEVGRDNLTTGPIAFATPATRILSTRAEERAPVRITIPATAFRPGTNTIAVEVHNTDRWSGDLSFDLTLTGQR